MHGYVGLGSEFFFLTTESLQNTLIFNFVVLIAAISFLLCEYTKQRIRICRVQIINYCCRQLIVRSQNALPSLALINPLYSSNLCTLPA